LPARRDQLHRSRDLVGTENPLAAPPAVDQPGADREHDPDAEADQRALEGVLDRQAVEEAEDEEDREETSSGAGAAALLHGAPMAERSGKRQRLGGEPNSFDDVPEARIVANGIEHLVRL